MTAKNARRRPSRQPKEPTPEQIKACLNLVLAMNRDAMLALARRGDNEMTVAKTRRPRQSRKRKEPTPEQIKAFLNLGLAMNEPALRALARR